VPHLVSEANLALERGDYRAGLEVAERALELQPGLPGARIVRARLLLQLARYDEVISEARAILDENPDDWAAHFILAYVSKAGERPAIPAAEHLAAVDRLAPESADVHVLRGLMAKSSTEAVGHYTRALDLDPAHTWALSERSHEYANLRDYDAARADAERLMAIRPHAARGRHNLGCAYRRERNFEQSEVEFGKAIELDPDDPDNYWERAWLYRDMRRYEDALADLARAIEIGPARATYYRERADVYYRMGRQEEAIAAARSALELNPDLREAFGFLLRAYQDLDRAEDFERTAEEGRARAAGWVDPEARAEAYRGLAELYQRAGDHEQALVEADRAVAADPQDVSARIQRIRVLRALNDEPGFEAECDALAALDLVDPHRLYYRAANLGWTCLRWEQAIEYLTPLIEDHPDWTHLHFQRGTAHSSLNHYEEALADLSRAIELDPERPMAYNNRANVYGRLQRYTEEEADRQKLFELEPRNEVNLGNMALGHFRLGQLEAALEDIDRALEVDPMYAWGHQVRASIHNALGRFEEAAADARRSIEIDSTRQSAYVSLFNAHEGRKDEQGMREAAEQLRAAADVWVDDEEAAWGFVSASDLSRQLDAYEQALDATERAVERDPDNPWGLITRARVRLDQNDHRSFRADCNAAAGIERENLNDRAWDARGLGMWCSHWEHARSALARILEEDARQVDAWFWRGQADLRLGRVEEALAAFDELLRIESENPRGYVGRAGARGARADCAGALADLAKARELVPERLDSQAYEAWIHAALLFHTCPGSYDGPAALDLAQAVVAAHPRKWEHLLPLGMALYRHQRFEEALAALEETLDLDVPTANEPLRLFPLAMTLAQLGRVDEARATYDRAVARMNDSSPRYPAFVLLRDEAAELLGSLP
jgi:tetratricopeptide (TPR) repeat protein